jgi:hypothetical protein
VRSYAPLLDRRERRARAGERLAAAPEPKEDG